MAETVPERIWIDLQAVVADDEGHRVTYDSENIHQEYVPATALEAAQARIRELEDMLTEDATAPYLAGLSRGRREALEEAAASMEADTNLHTSLCCNGHECGCHGASVGEYAAFMIRALMEKDNANR